MQKLFSSQLFVEGNSDEAQAASKAFGIDDILPVSLEALFRDDDFGFSAAGFFLEAGTPPRIRYSFRRLQRRCGGRQRQQHAARFQLLAWFLSSIEILNRLYCSRLTPCRKDSYIHSKEKDSNITATKIALVNLFERVRSFHDGDNPVLGEESAFASISSVLDRLDLGERYGSVTYRAEAIDPERIKYPETAGTVDLLDFLYDSEPWLEDPTLLIKEDFEVGKQSRVWASDDDWDAFVTQALPSGMFVLLEEEQIFRDSKGNKVLSGAFGVPKSGTTASGAQAQRFIINLEINKAIDWSKVSEDFRDPKLPYPSNLCLFSVSDGEVLITYGDDERNCFFIYRLPPSWYGLLAFNKKYRGKYVGLRVVPMGFCLSVGILQVVQRKIAALAHLDPHRELRPDQATPDPHVSKPSESIYSFYVDNFDEYCIIPEADLYLYQNVEGDLQRRIRREKERLNIPLDEAKALYGSTQFKTLGSYFDGRSFSVSKSKRKLIGLTWLYILFSNCMLNYGELASMIGVSSHCCMFNRPIFSLFSRVYPFLDSFRGGTWLPTSVFTELFSFTIMLQFLQCDIRRPLLPAVYSSDSSLWGAGFGKAPLDSSIVKKLLLCCDPRGTRVNLDNVRSSQLNAVKLPEPSLAANDDGPHEFIEDFSLPRNDEDFLFCADGQNNIESPVEADVVEGPPQDSDRHKNSILTVNPNNLCLDFRMMVQWKWKSYFQASVVPSDITLLEGNAFLSLEKHLLRDPQNFSSRFLEVFDSQGSLGAFAKGRSSSQRMNRLCRRHCALSVFGDLSAFFGWTNTECMPLDQASRVFPTSSAQVFRRYINVNFEPPPDFDDGQT